LSESPGAGQPSPAGPGDALVEVQDAAATDVAAAPEIPFDRDAQPGIGWPRERIPAFLFATSVSASSYTLIVLPTLVGSRDLDTELLILGSLLALLFTSVAIVTFAARLDGWQRFSGRLIERNWDDLDTCGAYLLLAHAAAMAGSLAWELARYGAAAEAGPSSLLVGVGLVFAGFLAAYAAQVLRSYGDLGLRPGQFWITLSIQTLMAGAAVWAVGVAAPAGVGLWLGALDGYMMLVLGMAALWILVSIQLLNSMTVAGYRLARQGAAAPGQVDHGSRRDQRIRRVHAWTVGIVLIAPIVYVAEGRLLGEMIPVLEGWSAPNDDSTDWFSRPAYPGTKSPVQSAKDYPIRELTPLGVALVGGPLVVLFCAVFVAPVVILIAFYSLLHKAIIPPLEVLSS
jgi:hypothetical protein